MSKDIRGDVAALLLTQSALLEKRRGKLAKALARVELNFAQKPSTVSKANLRQALASLEAGRDISKDNFLMTKLDGRDYMVKTEPPATFAVDLMRSISNFSAMKRVVPIDIQAVYQNESEALLQKIRGLEYLQSQGVVDDEELGKMKYLHSYLESGNSTIEYLQRISSAIATGHEIIIDPDFDEKFIQLSQDYEYAELLDLIEKGDNDAINSHCQSMIMDIRFNSLSGVKWDHSLVPDRDFVVLGGGDGIYGSVKVDDRVARLGIAEHAAMMAVFGEFDFNPRNLLKSKKTGKIVHIDQSPLINGYFMDHVDRRNSRLVGSFLTKDFLMTHIALDKSRFPAHHDIQSVIDADYGDEIKNRQARNQAFLKGYRVEGIDLIPAISSAIEGNRHLKEEFMHFIATLKQALALSDDDRLLTEYRSLVAERYGSIAERRVAEQINKLKLNAVEAKVMYGPLITLADEISISETKSSPHEKMQTIKKLYQDRLSEIGSLQSQITDHKIELMLQVGDMLDEIDPDDLDENLYLCCQFRRQDQELLKEDEKLLNRETALVADKIAQLKSTLEMGSKASPKRRLPATPVGKNEARAERKLPPAPPSKGVKVKSSNRIGQGFRLHNSK